MDKVRIKNKVEIEKMKRSGQAAATVLKRIGEAIAPWSIDCRNWNASHAIQLRKSTPHLPS